MANEINPSVALLALIDSRVRGGMDRRAATELVFRTYPEVARAHHEGRTIPRARPRLPASGPERRLPSDDPSHLRRGETMVHKLAAVGGGFYAVAA